MKKTFFYLIAAILIGITSTPSFAKNDKCLALAKLASTIYRNKADFNEFQTLQKWEATSTSIDFAFIRLFTGFAINVNKLPSNRFESATRDFCQKIVIVATTPELHTENTMTPSCQTIVAHSHLINAFKQSGDTPTTIRKQFLKTYGQKSSAHRGIVDYLSLMTEMRFSNLLAHRSDQDFIDFSEKSCSVFSLYTSKIDS